MIFVKSAHYYKPKRKKTLLQMEVFSDTWYVATLVYSCVTLCTPYFYFYRKGRPKNHSISLTTYNLWKTPAVLNIHRNIMQYIMTTCLQVANFKHIYVVRSKRSQSMSLCFTGEHNNLSSATTDSWLWTWFAV